MERILTTTKNFIVKTGGQYGTNYALFRNSDNAKLAIVSDQQPEYISSLIDILNTDK